MKIHVTYLAQLKTVRGRERETLEMESDATVRAVLRRLAQSHGTRLSDMLFNSEGNVRPSILIFAGEGQIDPESPEPLTDGQSLTLLSPMAGG